MNRLKAAWLAFKNPQHLECKFISVIDIGLAIENSCDLVIDADPFFKGDKISIGGKSYMIEGHIIRISRIEK
jgi:hypothetical protein